MADIDLTTATAEQIKAEVSRLEAYLANPGASRDTASRSASAHADIRECVTKYKELTGKPLESKHSGELPMSEILADIRAAQ